MNRLWRSMAAALAAAGCLWPVAAAAQEGPPTDRVVAAEQVRETYSANGFRVEPSVNWDWLSPPVSTFRVHDPARDRVLMVLVYASAAEARAGFAQARANEQDQESAIGAGPHLVTGYGASVWRGHVALVQTTQAELAGVSQGQHDRNIGMHSSLREAAAAGPTSYAVDFDFQQALDSITINL
jgi:hypothetical protein